MSRRPQRLKSLAGLVMAAAAASGDVAANDERTTADGVYTVEQARQGQAVHERHCVSCHPRSFYEGSFLTPWQGAPVSALYDVIELKMPEDAPGSLTPEQYAALLAWIFRLNDLPAGAKALSSDRQSMGRIQIESQDQLPER